MNDLTGVLGARLAAPGGTRWHLVAEQIVDLLIAAVQTAQTEVALSDLSDLRHLSPGTLSVAELFAAMDQGERTALDELALHGSLGATSNRWPPVVELLRRASYGLLAAFARRLVAAPGQESTREAVLTVRPVFELALHQEVHRAQRHHTPIAVVLFEVGNFHDLTARHGYRVGDRLMERVAIQVRRYLRKPDWVARWTADSLAALLPETRLDDALGLASRMRGMVEQRLVFRDYRTDSAIRVTVSAAVAGSDMAEAELDALTILAECEQALRRARASRQVERAAILAGAVTMLEAARVLDCPPLTIRRLLREGRLKVRRKGRHYLIDRTSLEAARQVLASRAQLGTP